jgi:hypothetical protein
VFFHSDRDVVALYWGWCGADNMSKERLQQYGGMYLALRALTRQ